MGWIEPRRVRLGELDVTIRSAEERDADDLLAHAADGFRTSVFTVTQAHEFTKTRDDEAAWIREHRDGPGHIAIVAEVAGAVGGLINFRNHPRQRMAHHGHFGIGVASAWRGRGIGRELLRALLEWAEAHPVIEKVCLGVFAGNTGARKLYRDMGFFEEGRRIAEFRFEDGTYHDDIQMSRFVKPHLAHLNTPGPRPTHEHTPPA